MIFMTKLYDHFVHYCMYQIFKMECYYLGSVQEMSETNPQYQNYEWVYFYILVINYIFTDN